MAIAYTRLIPETKETSLMSFSARFSKLPKDVDFRSSLNKTVGAICVDAGELPPHRLSVDGMNVESTGITLAEYGAMTPKDRQRLGIGPIICGLETVRLPLNPVSENICSKIGAIMLSAEKNGLYSLGNNYGFLVNHTVTPSQALDIK